MIKIAGTPNFKASVSQTKNGNDYKKTRFCTTAGAVTGTLAAGADIFVAATDKALKGMNLVQKAKKILPNALEFLAVGLAAGLVFDFAINKLRAKRADQNPMTLEQKFARDLKSKDYVARYDSTYDEVILGHKKDKKINYAPKYNVYRLQNDGSAALIGGKDFVPDPNTYIDNGDGTGKIITHTEKPFVENSGVVKNYVNAAKAAVLHDAMNDKENYSFKYDKEKDMVVLSRMPAMSIDGPVYFESFNFRPDGSISIVTANGEKEHKIEGRNGIMIFDEFADENTSVRKFKAVLNDALGEKENFSLSYNPKTEKLILAKKENDENNNKEEFSPYYAIDKYGRDGGARVVYVYAKSGDYYMSPNAKTIIEDSKALLNLYNSLKEQDENA
ncbi:MAG: hypothetical protein KHX03_05670 [Clostridium sp.]|nr:hypothetical protein [Clostridium sp.]